MRPLVLFGAGNIAAVAHAYLQAAGRTVAAFTVDDAFLTDKIHCGLPVVPFEDIGSSYPPGDFDMLVFVGYRHLNRLRADRFMRAKRLGYTLPSFVDPRAFLTPPVEIGENCFIFEANVLQPFSRIGDNCILWSGNHIGHHATIGDHCFLASHIVLSGNASVGDYSFVGVNATIADGVRVARDNIVGAGSLLLRDTEPESVMVGRDRRLEKNSLEVEL